MSAVDLQRLIQRATPRVEDVRSPDRQDFVRREHGHLTLREVVDAIDALEFTVDAFSMRMRDLPEVSSEATAVHGLYHAIRGLQIMGAHEPPAVGADVCELETQFCEPAAEAQPGWKEVVAAARSRGAEAFKKKDFAAAKQAYAEALHAAPREDCVDLHTLYSNHSAALLKCGQLKEALTQAKHCTDLAPSWPKGYYRVGCAQRQLGAYDKAVRAFSEGKEIEPDNNEWDREIQITERERSRQPDAMVRQLILNLLPELLRAWHRGASISPGILQVQVNAELNDFGVPKWELLRERREGAKAQIRYAMLSRRDHLANLAANLQGEPPEGVATGDIQGRPLRIPDIAGFLAAAAPSGVAAIHIDVKTSQGPGKMAAIVCTIPCDEQMVSFIAPHHDPPPPKGSIDAVLELQKRSGFPKALPQLLGFQAFPGDLNFPVVDLARDTCSAVPS